MKKSLKVVALICMMLLGLTACGENKNNENISNTGNANSQISNENGKNNESIIIEPVNKGFDIEKAFSNIEEMDGLNENTKLSEEEIKERFDFGNYQGLEMEVRSKENEDTISEVVIIKLGDMSQTEEVFSALLKRREALQEKYAENEEMLEIINNQDNVMQQEAGIVTFIISENAKEI